MGIYRLNGNFAVRLKALQLYIYWGALKGRNRIQLCPFRAQIQIVVFM
mgnify:CR=1 FL=1